jgi:putative ABC transport system permease protein
MSNLRLAVRNLVKTPFVTSVAILSVALGIGANSAIFSLFNQILLRPLPVPEPARLVNLVSPGPRSGSTSCGGAGSCDQVFSYPMFRDLERVQTVFTGIAAHNAAGVSLSWQGQSDGGGEGMLVSGSYFSVLGVQPALGRLVSADDDGRDKAGSYVAVLDYDYWKRRFGGRADVLNQALVVNGQPLTIIGVASEGFHGTTLGTRPLVYVPISLREVLVPRWKGLENRRSNWVYLFARLEPGVSVEEARASINGQFHSIINDVDVPLQKGMSPATLERFRARELNLEPGARGQSEMHGRAREPLTLLITITGLVLLICCANIANLLLVRGASRSTEMAVRLSIGASRWHIITQLLVESCLLGVLGGACGLIVARWTLSLITTTLLPVEAPEILSLELDSQVVIFAAGLSLGAGLLFGLFPALHSTRPDLITALKANAGQPSGAKSAARFRMTLATAQIALSMALLISAGLFTKSLLNVTRVDLGLNREKLIVFSISPAQSGYTADRTRALFERVEDEISAMPGVTSVTASMVRLISGNNYGSSFTVQGFQAGPETDTSSMYDRGGPDYFRTLGIPLLRGREFTRSDTLGSPKVAVVNEAFAKKFNLGMDAVGKRMSRDGNQLDIEIIGLARNSKYSEVKSEIYPVVVMPYRQDENLGFTNFYVRTSQDEQRLLALIPGVIRRLDPNLPVARLRTMETEVQGNVALDRFVTSMSGAFAALATLLAAIGLYGVLAYTVAQRTREFGLRMALGADTSHVRRLVLRQVAIMTLVGGVIGIASASALGRVAESLLFQMSARDPLIFTIATASLVLVAFGAGLLPAQRAARVNPMQALRYE